MRDGVEASQSPCGLRIRRLGVCDDLIGILGPYVDIKVEGFVVVQQCGDQVLLRTDIEYQFEVLQQRQ